MKISFKYQFENVEHSLDLMIDSLTDLKPILRKFGKYKREQVQEIFESEGPGWQPHAESTQISMPTRIKKRAEASLRTKLRRDVRRAHRRLEQGKGKLKALENRTEVLGEFERLTAGGKPEESKLDLKKANKLQARIGRAFTKAESQVGKVLGRMASSVKTEVDESSLTIMSKIPWAGIHNDGGVAGNNAQIPERKFLEWTPDDINQFVQIVEDHLLKRWEQS